MTYSEKLKDPRWQRKRLEILSRDGFKCRECKTETESLHVHHCFYRKDKDPWEYDDFVLISLCDECHKMRHLIESSVKEEYEKSMARLRTEEVGLIYEVLIRLTGKCKGQTRKELICDVIDFLDDRRNP